MPSPTGRASSGSGGNACERGKQGPIFLRRTAQQSLARALQVSARARLVVRLSSGRSALAAKQARRQFARADNEMQGEIAHRLRVCGSVLASYCAPSIACPFSHTHQMQCTCEPWTGATRTHSARYEQLVTAVSRPVLSGHP